MFKKLMTILITFFSLSTPEAGNLGHRAGGDYYKDLPENSLIVLEKSLNNLQSNSKFVYLEYDVQETFDQQLVVFHDKTLKRMLPNKYENKPFFLSLYQKKDFIERLKKSYKSIPEPKNLKICDLTFAELKTLYLKGNKDNLQQRVPLLQEFLQCAIKHRLVKPMVIEVKLLQTENARLDLLQKVVKFRKDYFSKVKVIKEATYDFPFDVGFMGFEKNWEFSYGSIENRRRWCGIFKKNGFYGMFAPYTHHNLCK